MMRLKGMFKFVLMMMCFGLLVWGSAESLQAGGGDQEPHSASSHAIAAHDAARHGSGKTENASVAQVGTMATDPGPTVSTHHDAIPNAVFGSAFRVSSACKGATPCSWNSPSTWTAGIIPDANQKVIIDGNVVVDTTSAIALAVGVYPGGTLSFRTDANTELKTGDLQVFEGGTLNIGTQAQPVAPNVTAKVTIRNLPLNASTDPGQYLRTFMAIDGNITIHGAARTPTFIRLAREPKAGDTTFLLESAVSGWRAGDRLVLPDTRHMRWDEVDTWLNKTNQWEEFVISGISADGRTITLASALRFDHLGARDGNGTLDFLPHVGNLTRNVVIGSEATIGGTGVAGHGLFTNRSNVDIRHALFREMGRTRIDPLNDSSNHIGRYAIHAHHLLGPTATPPNGYQYTFIGNAVDGGPATHRVKWGMAIHNTHYGLIQDNVVYNFAGSLIAFEDGPESYNVVDHNFVMRCIGEGARDDQLGREGVGFWARGPHNYFRNNVAANLQNRGVPETAYGYVFQMRQLGNVNVPNFKGADTSISGQYTTRNGNALPILQFDNNEVYGATAQGLTWWWLNSLDPTPQPNTQTVQIRNFKAWHIYNKVIYIYPSSNILIDGVTIRGKDPNNSACCSQGVVHADYAVKNVNFKNFDVQGMGAGIKFSTFQHGTISIEDSFFRTQGDAIWVPTSSSTNNSSLNGLPDKTVIVRNTRFSAWPGSSLNSISAAFDDQGAFNSYLSKSEIVVQSYQGNPNENFQVYYTDSRAEPDPPANCNRLTKPEIGGIVCSLSATNPCSSLSISPPSRSFGAAGGSGSVTVIAAADCSWTAASNASWVTITAGGSGTGNGTVSFTVQENTSTSSRSGAITISGQTFTVSQDGASPPPCSYSISPASQSFGAAGGSGSVAVTTASGCAWTAASNASWLTITAGSSGTSNGTVSFSVQQNTSTSSRTGTMTVAGQTFTVNQSGASPPADTTPPSTPANLNATAASSSQINLSWGASTDNVGVSGYRLERCQGSSCANFTQIATPTATSYTDAGLAANTAYRYRVRAADAAGNLSPFSAIASATTQSAPPPGGTRTLGYTSVGASVDSSDSNYINVIRFAMPSESGAAQSISVYIASPVSPAPNNQYQLAIYSDSNGSPGSLLATTQVGTIVSDSWNTLAISATLQPNATYWLGYNTNGATTTANNFRISPGATNQMTWRAQAFGNWPSPFGAREGSSNFVASIYVTYSVGSSPPPCSYSISPTSQSFAAQGGSGSVAVTAAQGCSWTAVSNAGWITITAGSSGTGNGTVSFSVQQNTSTSSRTGTMTVAGQTFTVNQDAAAPPPPPTCSYAISPTSKTHKVSGGTGSITVTAAGGCAWQATTSESWVTITQGSGTGIGTVRYSVSRNSTGRSRTGKITVAGKIFSIKQKG